MNAKHPLIVLDINGMRLDFGVNHVTHDRINIMSTAIYLRGSRNIKYEQRPALHFYYRLNNKKLSNI